MSTTIARLRELEQAAPGEVYATRRHVLVGKAGQRGMGHPDIFAISEHAALIAEMRNALPAILDALEAAVFCRRAYSSASPDEIPGCVQVLIHSLSALDKAAGRDGKAER